VKYLIILLLTFSHLGISQQIPIDKQKHFAAGFVLGGFSTMSREIKHPFWTSVAAATSAGLAKEYYDKQTGGTAEIADIYATVAGGALSGSIAYLIKRHRQNKKKTYLRYRWIYQQYR
jgi:hypothetical protein